MAIYSTSRNKLRRDNDDQFEVVLTGGGLTTYLPVGNLNAQADAFGKLRVANPHTLFDSSFRYSDNDNKWNTKVIGTGSALYQANQGLVNLTVGTANGDEVIRQSDRVFPYQPGKSLLIMESFTLNPAKENLRQRVGYFLRDSGVYLELDGSEAYFVLRSNVTGSVVNDRVPQSAWSVDKLDGTGPSGVVIDLSKSQILWMDIEWLGVGSIRYGFVINGQFIVAHISHHANTITGTYMATATLSCRYELANTGITASQSTLQQICSTVISEGGYQQSGITRSVATPLAGINLANNVNNPVISIRLRPGRTDAVVIPTELNLYGLQATAFIAKLIHKATVTGGTWIMMDSESSVEYNITSTGMTGGTILQENVIRGQSTVTPMVLSEIFNGALQLSREIITADSAGDILTLAVVPTSNNDDIIASLSWQEKTA